MPKLRYYLQGRFLQGSGNQGWQNIDRNGFTGLAADRGFRTKREAVSAAKYYATHSLHGFRRREPLPPVRVIAKPVKSVVWSELRRE